MLVENKVAFNQNAGNLGEWWRCNPQNPLTNILLGYEHF